MAVREHDGGRLPRGEAVLCVLTAGQFAQIHCAEQTLARLCAEEFVEVFDGVVVEWPASASRATLRSLRNLPRTAALPQAAWRVVEDRARAGCRGAAADPLGAAAAQLGPGMHAILAICAGSDGLRLVEAGERCGVVVTATDIDVNRYASTQIAGTRDFSGM